MNDLFSAAVKILEFCDQNGWQSCCVGGIAVQRWGEPRVTRNVDLSLLAGFGREQEFVDALLAEYRGRIADAGAFALRHWVVLLATAEGVPLDISLGALPFERLAVERASVYSFGHGLGLRTCSAEDLLVMKLFAGRPLDLRDAEGIALRNQSELDWEYVEEQRTPLAEAKEDFGILELLARLRVSWSLPKFAGGSAPARP